MAEITVTLPNGSTIAFPDGTSPDTIRAVARRAMAGGAKEDAPDVPTRGKDSMLSVAPGTTPEQAANIPEGMVYDPETGGYFDAAAQAERGGGLAGLATKYLQGTPFIGQYVDEAAGAIDRLINGSNPEIAQETVRQSQDRFDRENPKTAAVAQLAGGVVGSLPAVAAAPAMAAAAPNALAMQMGAGALAAGTAGAIEGGISGYGAGEGDNRASNALSGAMVGGGLGAVIGGSAPAVAAGARNALARWRGSDVAQIADTLGISPEAARAVKAAVDGEDLNAASASLARGGPDAMILEAGPSTRALGDAVGNSGNEATRIMRDAVADRVEKAAGEVGGVLDNALGKPTGRYDLAAQIRQGTAKARRTAYDAAYSSPIDYSSPQGRRIEDILTRMPEKAGASALRKANERMAYEGLTNQQIMAQVGDDGLVRFSEMPNAQQLDYIKRAFDEIAEDGKDVSGRISSDGAFAARIARDLRNAHASANPAYRDALRTGMDSIQSEKAVESGYKGLMNSTSREVFAREIRGLNPAQRDAAKLGARQYLDDQMANVQAIMSDPDLDAREALKGLKALSARASQDKLAILLGRPEAQRVAGEVDRLSTAFEIKASMAQNSKTAIRQAVQGSVDASSAPNVVQRLMAGEPVQATKRLAQLLTGATPEAQDAVKAGIYSEIAKALTEKRGPQAERALQVINKAMAGQKIKDATAASYARLIASALGVSANEAGKAIVRY